jgi:hypothetical protein
MTNRSKTIWLSAGVFIAIGIYQHSLGWLDLFATLGIANILDNCFGIDKSVSGARAPAPEVKKEEPAFSVPPGKHLITTDGVKQVRNLLLRHHNMKQTDRDYTESAMSKETVLIVANLNVFLKGKT